MDDGHDQPLIYYPAHIDGCSVVAIRRTRLGFARVESGFLSFDGKQLWLETEGGTRAFSHAEVNSLQLVAEGNQIVQCQGFVFFWIVEDG